jgi:aminobenzoyl-glutamate utilization protein B
MSLGRGKRASFVLATLVAAGSVAPVTAQPLADLMARMDARAEHYGQIAQRIWELAEVGYQEHESAALLREELRKAGFEIDEGVAGIPTAFVATWGSGRPLIGILGEYDALPGLSQVAVAEKKPRVEGGAGHGCGHNLLGTASALAALSVRDALLFRQAPGTVRFYGTPAEEGGGAKVFMLRAGMFTDLDAVLTWHPGDRNQASSASTLAVIDAKFRFRGQAAHAAHSPEAGRSALDAAMLTTHGIDLLREHVPQETRLHYVLPNGGAAPNIVPDFAELHLLARHPEPRVLDGIWERVLACARAGALATGTSVEETIVSSYASVLPNEALAGLLDKNLRLAGGGIRYSAEEQAFAEALRRTFPATTALPLGSQEGIQPPATGYESSSTDVGDVSWVVPTGQLITATDVPGTPGHSWQSTACAGSSIGRKGMLLAAKALTLTALELLTDPEQLKAARADFQARKAGAEYRSRLPADASPPLDYRGKTPAQP